MGSKSFSYLIDQIMRFDLDDVMENIFTKIIDSKWFQRLRHIYQTGCCRYVFPFSENSRFGHSIQSAYLMHKAVQVLKIRPSELSDALTLAALVHDIGHLAPGSHLAWKVWFNGDDQHEQVGSAIISDDSMRGIIPKTLFDLVFELLTRKRGCLPEFAYQLLHGDIWNVDRGSWIYSDAILSGLGIGIYNVDALIDSLLIENNTLTFKPKRSAAVFNFLVSRNTMYQQVFFHPKVLSAEVMLQKIVKRARFSHDSLFCDTTMHAFLTTDTWNSLQLCHVYHNNEAWFYYHLVRWSEQTIDLTLKDLCQRFLTRNLLKYRRVKRSELKPLRATIESLCATKNFDSEYYVDQVEAPKTRLAIPQAALKSLPEIAPLFVSHDEPCSPEDHVYLFFPEELSVP